MKEITTEDSRRLAVLFNLYGVQSLSRRMSIIGMFDSLEEIEKYLEELESDQSL